LVVSGEPRIFSERGKYIFETMSRNRHVPENLLRPRLLVRRERAVSEHHRRYVEDVPLSRSSPSRAR
jgi:hypothetical protein